MAKKSTQSRARRAKPAAEDQGAASGPNALTGALYHGGRMYDHRKKKDQEDFAKLIDKEGLAAPGVEKADRSKAHKEALQRLADRGVVKGYGTKAAKKSKDEDEEDTGASTETSREPVSEDDNA